MDDDNRFSLCSGERQVAPTLENVRADHLYRYNLVANLLKQYKPDEQLSGLDLFTATGYGSFIVASNTDCRIDAYDASSEAVDYAKEYYAHPGISYKTQCFPFPLPESEYDFIMCIESLEHIAQYEEMIAAMDKSLKPGGILFLSMPNEDVMSLGKVKNPFHIRHFLKSEIETWYLQEMGYKELVYYGQDAYKMRDGFRVGTLPPDGMIMRENHNGQWHMFVLQKKA